MDRYAQSTSTKEVTEITLVSRVRAGFVPARELGNTRSPIRYIDRLRHVLESFVELESVRFPTPVRRFAGIQFARWVILDDDMFALGERAADPHGGPPERRHYLLFTSNFDGSWDDYIRDFSLKIPTLMNVLWSNCDDYPVSGAQDWPRFRDFVHRQQKETATFYAHNPELAARDIEWMKRFCRKVLEPGKAIGVADARDEVEQELGLGETHSQRRQRQIDAWSVQHPGGLDAIKEGFDRVMTPLYPQHMADQARAEFFGAPPGLPQELERAVTRWNGDLRSQLQRDAQPNVLEPWLDEPAHARMLFCHFPEGLEGEARAWLEELLAEMNDGVAINVGFTIAGLRALGVTPRELDAFPEAFVQGMAKRAALNGDPPQARRFRKALHAIVIMHAAPGDVGGAADALAAESEAAWSARPERFLKRKDDTLPERLREAFDRLLPLKPIREMVLAHQDLHSLSHTEGTGASTTAERSREPEAEETEGSNGETDHRDNGHGARPFAIEYFGFRDGVGQPKLVGYEGAPNGDDSHRWRPVGDFVMEDRDEPLLRNGTFLVVRKLEQDIVGFHAAMQRRVDHTPGLNRRQYEEHVVGRTKNGAPLCGGGASGDPDDYSYDAQHGRGCPVHAHARRANPRVADNAHRIIRRGLSYVERDGEVDRRGLMFMAYNTDISNQFEYIQRNWVNRAPNSRSCDTDPLIGRRAEDPDGLGRSTFRSGHENSSTDRGHDDEPQLPQFVTLRWGEYFFVPSRSGLTSLIHSAEIHPGRTDPTPSELVGAAVTARTRDALATLNAAALRQWLDKTASSPRFWRGIDKAGGVVRYRLDEGSTTGWVFVSDRDALARVLDDDGSVFAVSEYRERMRRAGCPFLLGADGPAHKESRVGVDAMMPDATELNGVRETATRAALEFFSVRSRKAQFGGVRDDQPLRADFNTGELAGFVLGKVCESWFGIPDPPVPARVASWSRDLAFYLFFERPDKVTTEHALRAAAAFREHVRETYLRSRADIRSPRTPTNPSNPALVTRCRALLARVPEQTDDEIVNTLLGVTSGGLGAPAGTFRKAIGAYAERRTEAGGRLGADVDSPSFRFLSRELSNAQISGLDRIYRVCVRETDLEGRWGPVTVYPGDIVSLSQGFNAMLFGRGPHECPGDGLAKAVLDVLAKAFFGLPDLRMNGESYQDFSFDARLLLKRLAAKGGTPDASQLPGRKVQSMPVQ